MPEIDKFTTLAAFFFLAAAVPVSMLVASYMLSLVGLRPRPPLNEESPYKREAYECGSETVGSAHGQFNIRYYFFALLYLLFAVEAVFLFPWALQLKSLGLPGLLAMLVFLGIQGAGFAYEWKRGGLEWQ